MDSKAVKNINRWFVFPDLMATKTKVGKFLGYLTREDITMIRGAFPIGQNIQFTTSHNPTVRPGSVVVGTPVVSADYVKRAWTFEKRDGTEIEMKVVGTAVYYRIAGLMIDFVLLEDGFQDSEEWTYAIISESESINSKVYYCNGLDFWRVFTGEYAKYVSDNGSTEITVDTKLSSPAYLTTGQVDFDVAAWAVITNGSFRVNTDGTLYNVDGINFTGVTTMVGVAAKIQAKLRTATGKTETVEFKDLRFVITSSKGTSSSLLTVLITSTGTVGTDISGLGATDWMNGDTGHGYVTTRMTLGFMDGGALVDKNGIVISYTSLDGYVFKGCSAVPIAAVAGDILIQKPDTYGDNTMAKSSLAFVHDGRLHSRQESKKSVSNYSKLDNPDDWTTGALDGDGGAKEIEQGGPITAYAHDEKTLYIFKKRLIKTLQFIAGSTRIDVPQYGTLKPSDDKSITTGALGAKSTFHAPNGIIFTTPDKQLIFLKRESTIDYPQQLDLADSIRPTFQIGVHDEAVGIVYNSKVYYAYKQDTHSTKNDVVIVYDLIRSIWHEPYVGWGVSDWTIVEGKLHWHSVNSPDTHELSDIHLDGEFDYTTILQSWQENFGYAYNQKKISYAYLEIFMLRGTTINVAILYDINGISGQEIFVLDDTSGVIISDDDINPFGSSPFGYKQFGSNAEEAGMKRHRFILELKNNIPVFDAAIQIMTDSARSNYELVRFGYFVTQLFLLPPIDYVVGPSASDNLNLQAE
jgi:hypothetical protein